MVSNSTAPNTITEEDRAKSYRRDFGLASVMVVAGLGMSAVSLFDLATAHSLNNQQMAQATQPLQSSPSTPDNKPAESKPGGERPTTPAPEPARPDAAAQKAGATPVLPPAPAEKTAAPIQPK